jgi:DNA-binding NarL/FixJ family response regulator
MQKYKVLIIDDHPLICDSYQSALKEVGERHPELLMQVETAANCDVALEKINNTWVEKSWDLVFLDIRLPASSDRKILSGEDLGELLRKKYPETKIVVATTFNDNYRLYNIFKSLDPDGFLIKTDIDHKELVIALEIILNGAPYYSKTVVTLLRKQVSQEFVIDKFDRRMLYELSLGTKMKDLPEVLPLSIAGIEKRKRILKQNFGVEDQGDKALIQKAREKGFI